MVLRKKMALLVVGQWLIGLNKGGVCELTTMWLYKPEDAATAPEIPFDVA